VVTFYCSSCGEEHDGPPLSYGAAAPAPWYAIPTAERERRTTLDGELCVIDGDHHFVKGNIRLPILYGPEGIDHFAWTVWVSLSAANFARTKALWHTSGRESEPPYFGWLSTILPGYPSTGNLKTMVHTQPVGERPRIELEPTDHPLAVEQREGITMARVQEIAERVLHGT
jgi:hypothetical protein